MADKFSRGTGQAMKRGDGAKRSQSKINTPNQATGTNQAQVKKK